VSDVRESPAFDVIEGLKRLGAEVAYVDPHVPELEEAALKMQSVSPFASFASYDAIVVITNHRALDWPRMLAEAQLIVDTRDALRGTAGDRDKIVTL
jgi:UDP-N-acetyl-D-glucosamine dehydrogenase